MLSRGQNGRDIMQMVWLEDLVPKEHLLRKIDAAVNFDKIYEMVEELYCEDNGRPSIDPVVLVKMVLIQHLYGLPSLHFETRAFREFLLDSKSKQRTIYP